MKNEQKDFINEFTSNFAELFVETFLIKYADMFDMNEFPETILKAQQVVLEKIDRKRKNKLKALGYDLQDYE